MDTLHKGDNDDDDNNNNILAFSTKGLSSVRVMKIL
jgi:hypothetical protein